LAGQLDTGYYVRIYPNSPLHMLYGNCLQSNQYVPTFLPSTLGIPSSWGVTLQASVTVAAGSSQTYNLSLTTPLNAAVTTYNFYAVVMTQGGITASVEGQLIVQNVANSGNGNVGTNYVAFTATINPSQVTVGQQGSVQFQVAITNTGTEVANIYGGYTSG
jgi:uncharacterized membrane protein